MDSSYDHYHEGTDLFGRGNVPGPKTNHTQVVDKSLKNKIHSHSHKDRDGCPIDETETS